MFLLSPAPGYISGSSVTAVLPAIVQVARLARATVMVDLAPFLGKPAGGHQGIPVEPDRLEGFTPRAKRHDLYRLGDVFFLLDTGNPFVFDRG